VIIVAISILYVMRKCAIRQICIYFRTTIR